MTEPESAQQHGWRSKNTPFQQEKWLELCRHVGARAHGKIK